MIPIWPVNLELWNRKSTFEHLRAQNRRWEVAGSFETIINVQTDFVGSIQNSAAEFTLIVKMIGHFRRIRGL